MGFKRFKKLYEYCSSSGIKIIFRHYLKLFHKEKKGSPRTCHGSFYLFEGIKFLKIDINYPSHPIHEIAKGSFTNYVYKTR